MDEILNSAPHDPSLERLQPPEGGSEDAELRARWEAAQELRTAQENWLARREVLEDTPRLTMTRREYDLLKDVGHGKDDDFTPFLVDKTRQNYGIPPGAQHASVDIVPDAADQPHAGVNQPQTTELVAVYEENFGTTADEGELTSHGIEPGTPHLTMTRREFELFRAVGLDGSASDLIQHARDVCGIPWDDQYAPQYALIYIKSDDPTLPDESLLVDVTEVDFGTAIDPEDVIAEGRKYPSPSTPDSGGAYITVDIDEDGTFARSAHGLDTFAKAFVEGKTVNPLSGDFWVRAGGIAADQKDAYVWENGRPFTSAVELTIAFPGRYNSVCVVVGDRQDPANGKLGTMAQVKDPKVVLTIEGKDLIRLQEVYEDLYRVPGFALSDEQRRRRDEQFNGLVGLIAGAAQSKEEELAPVPSGALEIDAAYEYSTPTRPKLRARQRPL